MVHTHRPGKEVIEALKSHHVYVGRVWPSWPEHVRVTVGTQAEMDKFKTAYLQVMSAPAK